MSLGPSTDSRPLKLYFTFLLTIWSVQNNVDETEICHKFLFTVPLRVWTISDEIKLFQTGSVFTSVLCWQAHFYGTDISLDHQQ